MNSYCFLSIKTTVLNLKHSTFSCISSIKLAIIHTH